MSTSNIDRLALDALKSKYPEDFENFKHCLEVLVEKNINITASVSESISTIDSNTTPPAIPKLKQKLLDIKAKKQKMTPMPLEELLSKMAKDSGQVTDTNTTDFGIVPMQKDAEGIMEFNTPSSTKTEASSITNNDDFSKDERVQELLKQSSIDTIKIVLGYLEGKLQSDLPAEDIEEIISEMESELLGDNIVERDETTGDNNFDNFNSNLKDEISQVQKNLWEEDINSTFGDGLI